MTTIELAVQQALNNYNHLFNNTQYQTLADLLAADLHTSRDSVRTSDAMNLITNAALNLVNHPHYVDAWLKLALFCGQHSISLTTIDAIRNYLLIYQQPADTRAEDFELTAKALLSVYAGLGRLHTAVAYANGIHGWQGRTAYDLLTAADYLTQSALLLLIHEDLAYLHEKLQAGIYRIKGALTEGVRSSQQSERFDFSAIRFPQAVHLKDTIVSE